MRLLSWLLTRLDTPPIDVLSPPDRPEWDAELRRWQGLTETVRVPITNVVFAEFTKKKASRA